MTDIPLICANCEYFQSGVWCLIWSQPTQADNYCHHWEVSQELLPTFREVWETMKEADEKKGQV